MRFLELLTEAGVSLNGVVYPKFNNIVILAGAVPLAKDLFSITFFLSTVKSSISIILKIL